MGNKRLELEIERERQVRALESYLKTGHGMPKTRREFLASGMKAFGGYLMAPSILQLIMSSQAQAQVAGSCGPTATSGLAPFINVNLSGGAALHSNTVPLTINGAMLTSYGILGLGLPANFQVTRDFGNVPFATSGATLLSPFLDGLRTTAGTAKDKTAWVSVFARSQDDTDKNEMSIAGLVEQAGLKGALLPNLGNKGSRTGVDMQPAYRTPSQALRVSSFTDVLNAMTVDGAYTGMSDAQKSSLLDLVKNLSASQKARLSANPSGATLGQLVECATGKNLENTANIATAGVDPRLDPAVAAIWGIAPNSNAGQLTSASITYASLSGKAGAAGIDIGGYDYHGQARTTTDQKDRDAGALVGRILKTAEVMNKPVFIHVTSDGSVSAPSSDLPGVGFQGDYGTGGMSYVIAFNPSGRVQTSDHQIGGFTNGQGADDSFMVGWSAKVSSLAVFANYMKFNNRMDLFETVQNRTFDSAQVTKVLRFG